MEENEEFGVINLINDGIEEPEDVEVEQNKQVNLKRYIKKEAICDNFFFIYSLGIIQSLFSIGCFYIFYRFKIGDKSNKIYEIIMYILLGIIVISTHLIYCFIDYFKNWNNYIQYIIVNIIKFCVFVFVYLMTVLTGDNRIDFPHFEARVYWKMSMCLFYLLILFYYYFTKENGRVYVYAIISFAILLTYFFLTYFTQRKNDNWDRLWIYIIYLFFELSYILPFIFQFLVVFDEYKNERLLGWKLNDIDFAKIIFPLTLSVLWEEIAKSCKNCRFGKLLIKNLSI